MFPLPDSEPDPFPFCNPYQVLLQLQDLKRGAVINLNNRIIGNLFMLCQLPFPVFFNYFPDFVHSFNHKHPGIPKIVFGAIPIFKQEGIVLCIKGIDGVQQTRKMIVEAAPPDECISVCVCFDFCSVNVELFQRDKAFLFQTAHELVIQFIQDLSRQLFPFKIIKISIPPPFSWRHK